MNFDIEKLTSNRVMTSRIRLARNIAVLPFPKSGRADFDCDMTCFFDDALRSAKDVFDANLYFMRDLSKEQRMALVERHIISLGLANNEKNGAVIIEKHSENMSIMLNEEDHIREQCVVDGFDLDTAYQKIDKFDNALISNLKIAYDSEFGFLTSCPTNVGTGLRASTMLFLPALKLSGEITGVIDRFVGDYGLTIRGVYGEGSSAQGDIYQLSNTRTLGMSESEIINIVKKATIEMCLIEEKCLDKVKAERGVELFDKVSRSYGTLLYAYSLSSSELMQLISDVKLAVILGLVPAHDTKVFDRLTELNSPSSIKISMGDCSADERDIFRAGLVKKILSGVQ